ncbi:hypothetical protein E8E11_008156 [Didymella keratinophila]|nr:hypothetical protein E8E11_008156 [Didymella keratinophila]
MLDISGVSTEALKRELRFRQSQTAANPSPPASDLSDSYNFDEDTEEDNDDNTPFVPERRAARIRSGPRKPVEEPAAARLSTQQSPANFKEKQLKRKKPDFAKKHRLKENGWQEVKCPGHSCKVNLTYEEIKAYASREVFDRYDVMQAHNVLSADPSFRWCRAERCTSGQIHDIEEMGNEFVCVECHERFCIVHEGPYHDDETCDECEYRVGEQKERDERRREDEASEQAVGQLTKRCPGKMCGRPIEKNGGCIHMSCSQCKHQFCWTCLEGWVPRKCRH